MRSHAGVASRHFPGLKDGSPSSFPAPILMLTLKHISHLVGQYTMPLPHMYTLYYDM